MPQFIAWEHQNMEKAAIFKSTNGLLHTVKRHLLYWADQIYWERMAAAHRLLDGTVEHRHRATRVDPVRDNLERAVKLGYILEPDGRKVPIPAATRAQLSHQLKLL
jgi:hypothetical protein